jgi:hypothetical protein
MADDTVDKIIAEAIKALANWIGDFSYKSIGGNCPGCGHGPIYQRHVGFIIGGQHQQSCPCRLIRQSGRDHPCGCEWTRDI